MFKVTKLESIPPNSNPFHFDAFNMGTQIGNGLMLMHRNHPTEECPYLIIVNTVTGERMKLEFVVWGCGNPACRSSNCVECAHAYANDVLNNLYSGVGKNG